MAGQTVILRSDHQRFLAKKLVDGAPVDAVVNIRAATRTLDQNALMWALLSDVSRSQPEGRMHTPEVWKALFMSACGHAVQFENGLDGTPFPVGFRSSRLSKSQMSDMVEFIYAYGSSHEVQWSTPYPDQRSAQ